jgi:hypothetical protein
MIADELTKNISSENVPVNLAKSATPKRIDAHYLSHEFQHLLHFEKGFPYTIKQLLLRPGHAVREFLTEDRNKLTKPIPFLIFISLIYALISQYFPVTDVYGTDQYKFAKNSTAGIILSWVKVNYAYTDILISICIAFWVKLFFKKQAYNIFEILILLIFLNAMGTVFVSIAVVFGGVLNLPKLISIIYSLAFIYFIWATAQFFNQKKILNYVKVVIAFHLGSSTFYLILFAVGSACDLYIKLVRT